MNRERLLRLAQLLDQLEPSPTLHFDLIDWGVKRDCGTTACAVGHALLDPWFQGQGLHSAYPDALIPKFGDHYDWDAVELFFGTSYPDAKKLFSVHAYSSVERRDPKAVATRVRDFVDASEYRP